MNMRLIDPQLPFSTAITGSYLAPILRSTRAENGNRRTVQVVHYPLIGRHVFRFPRQRVSYGAAVQVRKSLWQVGHHYRSAPSVPESQSAIRLSTMIAIFSSSCFTAVSLPLDQECRRAQGRLGQYPYHLLKRLNLNMPEITAVSLKPVEWVLRFGEFSDPFIEVNSPQLHPDRPPSG